MSSLDPRRLASGLIRRLLKGRSLPSWTRSSDIATARADNDVLPSTQLPEARAVYHAWSELRRHPALVWIPPMWRSRVDDPAAFDVMRRRSVSAVDRNLVIDVEVQDDGSLMVRLATGPLMDRPVDGGIDPVAPAGGIDAKLDVQGSSFEEAVVKLYEAVQSHYGRATEVEAATPQRGAAMHLPGGL